MLGGAECCTTEPTNKTPLGIGEGEGGDLGEDMERERGESKGEVVGR